jgi:hypothetical protein
MNAAWNAAVFVIACYLVTHEVYDAKYQPVREIGERAIGSRNTVTMLAEQIVSAKMVSMMYVDCSRW